jgi:hypothetical protein
MRRLILLVVAAAAFGVFPLAASAAPQGELAYAEGQTYTMLGVTLITNASPGVLKAPPIYIMGYPVAPGTTGPITLANGYQPQCNPCLQEPVSYHDHLLTGAPGLGTNGTSGGDYESPWRIVIVMYAPGYAFSPFFEPITSDDGLAAAEQACESGQGCDLLPINAGSPNPYEKPTPNVLVCPIVRQNGSGR